MGKVFSPAEIHAGNVPEPGAHNAAALFIVDALFKPTLDLFNNNGVDGGMIYGSTAMGSANMRSDVDVLATYDQNRADRALPMIRRVLHRARVDYKVPVESNILAVGAVYSPLEHAIDPLFAKHLLEIQEQDDPRWSYNWPVSGLALAPSAVTKENVRMVAIRYCSAKARRLARGLIEQSDEPDYKTMQRALELPAAIGRKVLAVANGIGFVDQSVLQDKDNATLGTAQFLDRIIGTGWSNFKQVLPNFLELSAIDTAYSTILTEVVVGKASEREYEDFLNQNHERSVLLGIDVASTMVDILRDRIDTRDYKQETQEFEAQVEQERQEMLALGIDPDLEYYSY